MASKKKRPRSEKVETEIPFVTSTTRMYSVSKVVRIPDSWTKMHPNLTTKNFRKKLDRIVKDASRAFFVASLVLDSYARICHAKGEAMSFRSAIRQALAVCKTGCRYPTVANLGKAFEQLVPQLEKTFGVKRAGAGRVLEALWFPNDVLAFASQAMWSTTLWLYSTEAIWKHLDAVIRAKFPVLTVDKRDRILEKLQGDGDLELDTDTKAACTWLEEKGLVARFRELVVLISKEKDAEKKPAARDAIMSKATSTRIEMLSLMEAEIKTDEELQSRFRKFSIVPEFSARRHFVRIDKSALEEIVNKLIKPVVKESASRKRARKDGELTAEDFEDAPEAQPVPSPSKVVTDQKKSGKKTRVRKMNTPEDLVWKSKGDYNLSSNLGIRSFLKTIEVEHVLNLPKAHARKIDNIFNSWTTDGVQLHVTLEKKFTRNIMWPIGCQTPEKPLQVQQDSQSSRPADFLDRSYGLFRADCLLMKHLEEKEKGKDFNLVFVDPGVANIFTGITVPFSAWKEGQGKPGEKPEVRSLKRGEYYHILGAKRDRFISDKYYEGKKDKRRFGWRPEQVRKAYEALSDGGSTHVGNQEQALEAAKKRIRLLIGGSVWRFVSSRTHAQLRFQRTMRKQRALDTLAHKLAPNKDDVVVMGDWFGRRALKGEDLTTPVRAVRRHLQKQNQVVVMNEYNTSCRCSACCSEDHKVVHPALERMLTKAAWAKRIQKEQEKVKRVLTSEERQKLRTVNRKINGLSRCPSCESYGSRDTNAARNFSIGFYHMCNNKHERPAYLARPSCGSPRQAVPAAKRATQPRSTKGQPGQVDSCQPQADEDLHKSILAVGCEL